MAAAKYIGAGLAAIGLIGAGVGIGSIFSSLISSTARNPALRGRDQGDRPLFRAARQTARRRRGGRSGAGIDQAQDAHLRSRAIQGPLPVGAQGTDRRQAGASRARAGDGRDGDAEGGQPDGRVAPVAAPAGRTGKAGGTKDTHRKDGAKEGAGKGEGTKGGLGRFPVRLNRTGRSKFLFCRTF